MTDNTVTMTTLQVTAVLLVVVVKVIESDKSEREMINDSHMVRAPPGARELERGGCLRVCVFVQV